RQSYEDYAWPRAFGAAYRRNGTVVSLALAAGLALFLILAIATGGGLTGARAGSFYAVFPHGLMVTVFGIAFLYAILALGLSARRFSQEINRGQIPRSA